jgi:hypothetical protein
MPSALQVSAEGIVLFDRLTMLQEAYNSRMPDLNEQTSILRRTREKARESLEQHTADLRGMRDVANRAAHDLETRKKYRRQRAESVTRRERKPA